MIRLCYWTAAFALICMMMVGAVDIVALNIGKWTVPSADLIQATLMSVVVFCGLVKAQARDEHIKVDVIINLLSARARRICWRLSLIVGAIILSITAWETGIYAYKSWIIGEKAVGIWAFPIYPFKASVAFGCGMAALVSVKMLWTREGG